METVGIELTTYRMRSDRSTTELCPLLDLHETSRALSMLRLFSVQIEEHAPDLADE